MIISIRDSTSKILHLNPQFVTKIRDSGRGYFSVYDIAGNLSYVSDPDSIARLIEAMEACGEVCIMPEQARSPGFPFDLAYGDDGLEEEEIPEPAKKPSRAKKSAKA